VRDWEGRPTGTRFVAIPALLAAEELSDIVLEAIASPYLEVGPRERPLPLTREQVEVLGLVAAGLTNDEIALQRGTSTNAVRNMIGRIVQRLELDAENGSNVRAALVRYLLVDHVRSGGGGGMTADNEVGAAS
jgi:DNA-binding NarL/FixJ family response regulator